MQIEQQENGSIAILRIEGQLVANNAYLLKNQFNGMIVQSRDFVIDLSRMDYIDSTGLGSLVSCLRCATENGGTIKLCGLQDKPKMLFDITKAYKIFDIYGTPEQAIASFQNH